MPIEEILVGCIYGIQLVICVLFALDYKRGKRDIPLLVVFSMLSFVGANFFSFEVNETWIYGLIIEVSSAFFIIGYFAKGSIWRNYFIVWFNFQIENLLFYIEYYFFAELTKTTSATLFGADGKLGSVLLEGTMYVFNATIVSVFISKRIFKHPYKKDETIYKIITGSLITISSMIAAYKQITFRKIEENNAYSTVKELNLYVLYAAYVVATLYLAGYLYNKVEAKRLEKEKKELQLLLENNYLQYKNVVDSNKKLEEYRDGTMQIHEGVNGAPSTISLSGNLALDALVEAWNNRLKSEKIAFEICIMPFVDEALEKCEIDLDATMRLTAVVDNLIKTAYYYCKKYAGDKWISLSVCQKGENIILKTQFPISVKKIKPTPEIKLVKKVVELCDGVMEISCKEDEAGISVLCS